MSIIQTIRDKGAAIVIGVIALSLIGFLLMDARSGASKGLFSGNTTSIGSVNGSSIEIDAYNAKVKEAEQQYPNVKGPMRQQIMQGVWDQMTGEKIVTTQFEKLGLEFTPKEMSAIMFSDEAPQQLKQAFTDQQTGQYDIEKVKQWWAQTKKNKNTEQRDQINSQVIAPMRINSLYTKYTSMIAASMYTPAWLAAKENEETKSFANISYVAIPYSEISDSAVKVSDNDIQNYLDKHKAKYKQEAGRMISYVTFNAAASPKDSAAIKDALSAMKNNFAADTNAKAFIARNISAINYADIYKTKAKIESSVKDTLIGLPQGTVFGPYLDGANFVLAKKVSTKILPDSIKCRHILLGTNDPQTGAVLMPDSTAKQKADSVEAAIKGGANFDSLEAKYSSDKTAHKDKGVMTFDLETVQGENFAKEFGDFLLNENGETKKVIKTQFGYHYIEILEKKNPQQVYKIAFMAKEIVAGDETVNGANSAATRLSGMARDTKALNKYVTENGIKKIDVPGVIKENDYQLGSLQDARPIIKWAFEAKEGEVSDQSFNMGDQVVVAAVTKVVSEGLPDVKTARLQVESIIRNAKKAEEIKKKLNNPPTLEAAAAVYKKQILNTGTDSTLTFSAQIVNGVGNEPKVVGAAFNKQYQTKVSSPIAGNTGVFVIKVNSISVKPGDAPEVLQQQKSAASGQAVQTAIGQSFNALKKMANIKDKRSKFF